MSLQTHHNQPSAATKTRSTRVAVISGSVRDGRMGPKVADWVARTLDEMAETANGPLTVDLIDVSTITLPEDSRLYPGGGPTSEVAGRIESADAFVFVTPEYNHSYPASLKRLIDWHYSEWMLKPATVVAYGVQGGHAAIEHLRGVLAELNMVTTRRVLGVARPWESLDAEQQFDPDEGTHRGLAGALAELAWWADLLSAARAERPFPA